MAIVKSKATHKNTQPTLTDADIEWIEERAGILEFDAGLTREEAEKEALRLFREYQASLLTSSDGMGM